MSVDAGKGESLEMKIVDRESVTLPFDSEDSLGKRHRDQLLIDRSISRFVVKGSCFSINKELAGLVEERSDIFDKESGVWDSGTVQNSRKSDDTGSKIDVLDREMMMQPVEWPQLNRCLRIIEIRKSSGSVLDAARGNAVFEEIVSASNFSFGGVRFAGNDPGRAVLENRMNRMT